MAIVRQNKNAYRLVRYPSDLGVDGRIILKWTSRNGMGMEWINLAQDTNKYQEFVR
jgi:hypothetical protein